MSDPRGRFVWYELMTTDPEAAQEFYREIVGWSTAPFEDAKVPYTMWMNGERPVGGVMELSEEARKAGAPPQWLAYIATPAVDETAEKVTELGGKVLKGPETTASVGRWVILQDPQGAVFAAYKSATEPDGGDDRPGAGQSKVGEFSWHELATTDHEAALDFYSELFGWEKTESMDMGEAGMYQMYGQRGQTYGGIYNKTADMPGPPAWLFYATVPSADKAAEKIKASGGQVLNGPMEVPGGDRVAQCLDPQGAAFAVHAAAVGAGPTG